MPSIAKPRVAHPSLKRNDVGLTVRDYEGTMSTLCAGCGHDSITGALIRSLWELSIPPHMIAKMSGIGCSSKTPTYFVNGAHGFNSAHGRMPAIVTGASAANRDLTYIGISGDGDSLSIGLGHLCHAIRRNLNMLYVIENNGVYGLTKGQFSASADVGSKSKKGEANLMAPIDSVQLALSIGATFVARSFSGDKEHLIPILMAGLKHRGLALIDVISPCVTFNDHEGSTRSYLYTRQHLHEATEANFVPPQHEIVADIAKLGGTNVTMHDGSVIHFTRVPDNYQVNDRLAAMQYLRDHPNEVVTGILYADESVPDMHEMINTSETPLAQVPYDRLCPGSAVLDALQGQYR
ncbi:MAG TPA: 2-oxoacid:ferredoxin oxidoreductase subunit beta [Bryobacteraceae bacterium]|nr:2-oxoacid:ferredoxin oxidoreductase subunit beta [Bryobacteraceae bacterium]